MPKKKPTNPQPSSILSAENADKLLRANDALLVRKLKEGKSLTGPQVARLQQIRDGVTDPQTLAETPSRVQTVTALAGVLGVTRRSIQKWRKRFGDEAPKAQPNGMMDVAAWREFIRAKGLKDGSETDDDDDTTEYWRKRDLKAKAEEREHKLAVQRGEYLLKEDVAESITALVSETIKMLRDKFENELPPVCAGLDAVRIREENSRAIDDVCNLLHRGPAMSSPEVGEDDEEEDD